MSVRSDSMGILDPPPIDHWEWLVVAAITLAGAVLRFWQLDVLPPGLWYDEAINGLDAWGILHDPGWPIFFMTEGHPREPLYLYLEALGVLIGGPNATAIRGVSAAIGTLTIPAVWWMARQFMSPRAALLAAFFFVFMRWHVHFSRLAFRTILTPLFAALITGFLVRALRRGRTRDSVAVGGLLGLSLYTYLSMRLFLIVVLAGIGLGIWWKVKEGTASSGRRAFSLGLLAAVAVFLPLGWNYIAHPEHFSGREQEVSLLGQGPPGWTKIAIQARDVALMAVLRGDHVAKHNIPGPPRFVQSILWSTDGPDSHAQWTDRRRSGDSEMDPHGTGVPVFDLLTGLVFHIGLCLAGWGIVKMRWADAFLVLWLGVGSLASILSFGAPNMLRLLLLTPAVAAILALAAERALAAIGARWGRRTGIALLLLFLAWFAAGETWRYFHAWRNHPGTGYEFNNTFANLARHLRSAEQAPDVIIVPEAIYRSPTFEFETKSMSSVISDIALPRSLEGRIWVVAPELPWPPLRPLDLNEEHVEQRPVRELQDPFGNTWARIVELRVSGGTR